jgi:hypothetical protein
LLIDLLGQQNPYVGVLLGQQNPYVGILLGQQNPYVGILLGQQNPYVGILLGVCCPNIGFGITFPFWEILLKFPTNSPKKHLFHMLGIHKTFLFM